MHVWRFYLDRSKVKESRNYAFEKLSEKYPLYAVTNDRKKAKEFMKDRNMKLFLIKDSDVEKEEWMEYCGRHRGCVLQYSTFTTKNPNPGKGAVDLEAFCKEVTILVTFNEKNDTEDYINGEFGGILSPPSFTTYPISSWLPPAAYTSVFRFVLTILQYNISFKFGIVGDGGYDVGDVNRRPLLFEEDDYSAFSGKYCGTREFVFDELTVFIWYFGYLFKK